MIIALVHYKEWEDAEHPMLDGGYVEKSKVVRVFDLLDLNDLFKSITKIDVLQTNAPIQEY